MKEILAVLPPEVRDHLRRNAEDIMRRFERSFRKRIPDYDDQFRQMHFDREEGGGPATINLLRPPVDGDQSSNRVPANPASYLLGALDPVRAPKLTHRQYIHMQTLPGLDT